MKQKIFFHKNQSDRIIFHIFIDSLFQNDNINRKSNSNIRQFEDPRLLLCCHTICFQCIRVGTRINGNFDCSLRDSITISQIDQLPLNRIVENIIDCLRKMNSSLRSSSIVVNSSTVSTSINRGNGNTSSIAQATVIILIFNQEQLETITRNTEKEKRFNFYSSSLDY